MRLKEKAVVVTGAASGIGRAAALCCAQERAWVGVLDLDREGVETTVEEIRALGGTAHGIGVDVREEAGVRAAMEAVEEAFGRIDGLIHTAGVLEGALVEVDLFEEATWDRVIDVNLKGSFLAAKYAAPTMARAGGGVLVLISSGAGVRGGSSSVAYGASKGGVHGLSLVLAAQLAPRNIRVHAVCPGNIETPLEDAGGGKAGAQGRPAAGRDEGRTGSAGGRGEGTGVPGVGRGGLRAGDDLHTVAQEVPMKELKGMCSALCTPFTDDGEQVDETALRNHLDSMIEAGIHIILVCGGTGEFSYLRSEERRRNRRGRFETY